MQNTLINMDADLAARLNAYRHLCQRLDAGTAQEELSVRLPAEETAPLGLMPGKGLRAAGALLGYALLGRETEDVPELMAAQAQEHPERSVRRVCQMATDMLREDAAFSQAGLYAALRTVMVFLPENAQEADLPGLIRESDAAREEERPVFTLEARYAWAEHAAIAYFTLPVGVEEARVGDTVYPAAQCRAGVCLPGDCEEIPVQWGDGSAVLRPQDPLKGLRLTVGFRLGWLFLRAGRTPRWLWKRLRPVLRVQGAPGAKTPEMRAITSAGEMRESAMTLPKNVAYLPCPALSPQKDTCVELRLPGVRYLDVRGED